jgi:hypothetical protein
MPSSERVKYTRLLKEAAGVSRRRDVQDDEPEGLLFH